MHDGPVDDGCLLVGRPVGGVDERHRGLDVGLDTALERRVDEDSRRFGPQPVVLLPRPGLVEQIERPDLGREMEYRVDVAHRLLDGTGVEQIEFAVRGREPLVPGRFGPRQERATEDPGPSGDQQAHRARPHVIARDDISGLVDHDSSLSSR